MDDVQDGVEGGGGRDGDVLGHEGTTTSAQDYREAIG